MSKPKFRTAADTCADCSAPDPVWASVNRGVYMCNDCAGIHRNLGRHVSQVKHLHRSTWHPNQQNMVHQLAMVGSNSIWEHSLLDPAQMRSGKRKPNPSDSVHPTKNEFIRAKYEQLAYVHRPPRRDDDDLGKQLHSSVRTANLDTSLRLLSLGAQANYFHMDRGNTPLHVAAKAGQSLQCELLVTYGADPAALDSNRLPPEDLARNEGHTELADRLVELQYELSDRLSYFVWGLKPDHKTRNHYAMPKVRDNGVGLDGRKRLQALSNQIFEELAMDVYDEVDRRETELIWQQHKQSGGKVAPTADHVAVPFLTVNPEYSTTRNQGRQKLARFTQQEFFVLITDILCDIIRRQSLYDGSNNNLLQRSLSSEDPIYDLPPDGNLDYQSIENSAVRGNQQVSIPLSEFLKVKQKLQEKEETVTKLMELNRDLSTKVTNLAKQNYELLKQKPQPGQYTSAFRPTPYTAPNSKPPFTPSSTISPRSGSANSITRPTSSYNHNDSFGSQSSLASSGSQRRQTIHETLGGSHAKPEPEFVTSTKDKTMDDSMKKPHRLRDQSPHNSVGSDYDNSGPPGGSTEQSRSKRTSPASMEATTDKKNTSVDQNVNINENNNHATEKSESPSAQVEGTPHKPEHLQRYDEVIRKTETVTRNISSLLQAAQKGKSESYPACAENILTVVQEIVALFPEDLNDPDMKNVIIKLGGGAEKLRNRCKEVAEQGIAFNAKQVTEEIIKNAYDIAKAEKELVTMITKLQSLETSQDSSS
uniref:Zinc finger protein n=1 Tax=Ciona intestinalis TaxID=7719 RepID=Q1RLG9_CIOIN|nr:zinc finger protein Ci-ArfGAP-3 [Ciona intestinalis]FAA00096.1 TPA: zinc finger protein [Ciona intestinalis]|eukprot:NP_001121597.1 zinc finger protein Ci-ArfGAP-3 [Ciona intestinalis]